MIFFCLGCGCKNYDKDLLSTYLCGCCQNKLKILERKVVIPLQNGEGCFDHRVWILYEYRSILREILLNSKIKNDYHSLRCICAFILKFPEVIFLIEWADVIMPVPSSLWGRLRGRFDIAGYLACQLADYSGKTFKSCTWKLAYKFRKRAKLQGIEKSLPSDRTQIIDKFLIKLKQFGLSSIDKRSASDLNNVQRILVIDDIYTTGFTMRKIAKHYPKMKIRFLAIAGSSLKI